MDENKKEIGGNILLKKNKHKFTSIISYKNNEITFKKSNDLLGYIKPDPVGSSTVETHPNGRRITYEDSEI